MIFTINRSNVSQINNILIEYYGSVWFNGKKIEKRKITEID
jgi:hypothetical protein